MALRSVRLAGRRFAVTTAAGRDEATACERPPWFTGARAGPSGPAALLAAAGAGAGSLILHQTGAIIAVVAWALVIELVVGATVTALGRFLPYTAAAMLAGETNGGGIQPL